MKFTLEFELDNDQFVDETGEVRPSEIAWTLEDVALWIKEERPEAGHGRIIRDENGNRIGDWWIKR